MATKPLHAQHQHIKRSSGRSACASAAYRSGEKITDLRTGETFDYTRKQRVDANLLIGWEGTNAELWQAVELAERRTDAKLADEHEVSIPACMSVEHRQQLALKIAQALAAEYGTGHGVAPTLASLHNLYPPEPGENRTDNPHAHIMIATRCADPTTATGLNAEKLPCHWSKSKRDKHGLGFESPSARCTRLRELIADTINAELERHGYEDRVDHRSYAERGLDIMPQKHLGPAATAMERRGQRTELGDHNRKVVDFNQRRQAVQREGTAVGRELRGVTAEIVDLQAYRQDLRQQQRDSWIDHERDQCAGLNSTRLEQRANTWRNPEAPPTPEIRKLREQLEQLQLAGGWDDWSEEWRGGDLRSNVYRAEKQLEQERQRAGVGWFKRQAAKVLPFVNPERVRQAEHRLEQARDAWNTAPDRAAALEQRLEKLTSDWQRNWGERLEERTAKAELIEQKLAPAAVQFEAKAAAKAAEKLAREQDRERRVDAMANTLSRDKAPSGALDLDAMAKPKQEPKQQPDRPKRKSKSKGMEL